LTKADGVIPPAALKAVATAIKAHIAEPDGNHVIMWTKPCEVADVIIAAANSVH
jgi:hypothetical protein